MTKAEDEDVEIDSFTTDDDTEVDVIASENDIVRLVIGERTITNVLAFLPHEADRIAQAMLKAVEHIKTRKA